MASKTPLSRTFRKAFSLTMTLFKSKASPGVAGIGWPVAGSTETDEASGELLIMKLIPRFSALASTRFVVEVFNHFA